MRPARIASAHRVATRGWPARAHAEVSARSGTCGQSLVFVMAYGAERFPIETVDSPRREADEVLELLAVRRFPLGRFGLAPREFFTAEREERVEESGRGADVGEELARAVEEVSELIGFRQRVAWTGSRHARAAECNTGGPRCCTTP